jgi:hypothetical protein
MMMGKDREGSIVYLIPGARCIVAERIVLFGFG